MKQQLAARSLIYAILISIFVALICSAFLLGSYHQRLLLQHYHSQEQLLHNLEASTALLLAQAVEELPSTSIDLYNTSRDSCRLEQYAWGLWDVGVVHAWSRMGFNPLQERYFFIGSPLPALALRLAEGSEPLTLCGATKIRGRAQVPREGVQRGFIQNQPFVYSELVEGPTEVVKLQPPNEQLKARFEQLATWQQANNTATIQGDSLIQSFGTAMSVLRGQDFWLSGTLKGRILVVADRSIVVPPTGQLEDVILIAPTIVIQSGFQGSLQAFASDTLLVEPNVYLDYPSALGLLPLDRDNTVVKPFLQVATGSELVGAIVAPRFDYHPNKPIVQLVDSSLVQGQLWVNGALQQEGIVLGSVFCENFLLRTSGALYTNYLLNATIDRVALSDYYLAPSLLNPKASRQVLKRLF